MKPNSDEPIDRLVRQALRDGADSPRPAFNPERTWSRLSQELQQEKPRRRPVGALWAAGLAGLLVLLGAGWYLDALQPDGTGLKGLKSAGKVRLQPRPQPAAPAPAAVRTAQNGTVKPLTRPNRPVAEPVKLAENSREDQPGALPSTTHSPTATADSAVRSDARSLAQGTIPESRTATVATTVTARPKRRFQVMHVNEYQAEEDAQPRLYRTENLVRLGTASPLPEPRPAPSIQINLSQRAKSN